MRDAFLAAVVGVLVAGGLAASSVAQGVKVTANEAERRVDISIDGKPFTSYLWPASIKKPVLYPLITDHGITVTRGYPLEPRPGERVDHPHHAGLWLNYGDVNGFDFWNNSDAIMPEDRHKMGSIEQTKIVSAKGGAESGELVVDSAWTTGEGKHILDQMTRYVFARREHERSIDEVVTLKALDRAVFRDDKEGLLGMRVASWLESPEEKGGEFRDANGKITKVQGGGSSGASGVYLTSESVRGGAAWGTRGRWCSLTGQTDGQTVTIAILDHPGNPGYPTYWHARGYGLFAANPLGRSIFDPRQPAFNFTLEKGQTATFRYRVLLISQGANPAELNREADAFAAEVK